MKILPILIVSLGAAVTISCGSDDDDVMVQGVWNAACHTDDPSNIENYVTERWEFAEDSFSAKLVFFDANDTSCSSDTQVTVEFSGTWDLTEEDDTGDDDTSDIVTGDLDFKITKLDLTPNVSVLVDQYNGVVLAEYSDWKLNEPKSLIDRKIGLKGVIVPKDSTIYDRFSLEDNKLKLGNPYVTALEDGLPTTVEGRPTQVRSIVFTLQE